jgi:hypothetical protein
VDTLVQSLEKLIRQSTEVLGPEDPATLNLQRQLAALLESQQQKAPKVFWIQPDAGTDLKR